MFSKTARGFQFEVNSSSRGRVRRCFPWCSNTVTPPAPRHNGQGCSFAWRAMRRVKTSMTSSDRTVGTHRVTTMAGSRFSLKTCMRRRGVFPRCLGTREVYGEGVISTLKWDFSGSTALSPSTFKTPSRHLTVNLLACKSLDKTPNTIPRQIVLRVSET